MDTCTGKPAEPQGLSMFQLFGLYVVASQLVNVVVIILPVLQRQIPIAEYGGLLDVGFLLLIVVATCVALRWWRDAIVRSELAPFYAMLGFALLLPYIRQLLAGAAMLIAELLVMGQLRPIWNDVTLMPLFGVEPNRMILQIPLGAGAAVGWYLVLKLIFGANVQRVLRRETWLLLPFLLYAIALPAAIGFGVLIRHLTVASSYYNTYTYSLNYALAICVISIGLIALRGAMRRELWPAYLVLSFVLLMESCHNLIDREILHVVRSVTNDRMPWEEGLPIREQIKTSHYVVVAAYQTVLNVIGAAAAYGILRLASGRDLAAVVGRIEPTETKAGHAG
jgi:hypothetical protein